MIVGAGAPRPTRLGRSDGGGLMGPGITAAYLSLLVLIPIAAILWRSVSDGLDDFVAAVTSAQAVAALQLTLVLALVVMGISMVMGSLIAWVLVRDDFRGKAAINALIDLPFALPTIVAGLTLLALYGPQSPFGVNVAFSQVGIVLALLFITLPFVVRAVQPVLQELDREMEEPAASLGAPTPTVIRRIILPNLWPAILSGAALGFARCIGEFGSVVLISGNIPYRTELSSVYIYGQVEADRPGSAAAVSVVMLVVSLGLLAGFDLLRRRATAHAEPAA